MADAHESLTSSRRCAHCGGPTDVRTPHVTIEGNAIRAYCSAECVAGAATPIATPPPVLPPAGTPWWRWVARVTLTVPMLAFASGHEPPPPAPPPSAIAAPAPLPRVVAAP